MNLIHHIIRENKNTFSFQYEDYNKYNLSQKQCRNIMAKWCKKSFVGTWKLGPCVVIDGYSFMSIDQLTMDNQSDLMIFILRWL